MKDHLKTTLASFFISVTLINAAMFILGLMLEPDLEFGYKAFAFPLIYGLIGSLPGLIMYSKKELSVRQTIIRELIQMFLIIVFLISFMFIGFRDKEKIISQIIGVTISIVIIYVLVHFFGWLMDLKTAGKMTEELKRYQETVSEDYK